MTNATDLPDDPRECCRAAMAIVRNTEDEHASWAVESVLAALYEMEAASTDECSDAKCWMIHKAKSAFEVMDFERREIMKLVRHGTMDHREQDERSEQASFSPSVGEIDVLHAAFKLVGIERSREQVVGILRTIGIKRGESRQTA
ncbi:MAG: hypothetical protein AAF479_05615 [Pseudomonadota bacterium]